MARNEIENHWLYNILIAIEFMVHGYLFYNLLIKPAQKKLIIIYLALLFIFVIVNPLVFLQPFTQFQTNVNVAGGVGSFVLSILYCIQLYNSESTFPITK